MKINKYSQLMVFAICCNLSSTVWSQKDDTTTAREILSAVNKHIKATVYESSASPESIYEMKLVARSTDPGQMATIVDTVIQMRHLGLADELKLIWWESFTPHTRICILAILIGDGEGDYEERMKKYFDKALTQFEGKVLNLRASELKAAKSIGGEVNFLVRSARIKPIK